MPIESEDLDRLDVELTHSVDICDFVSLEDVLVIETVYYADEVRRPEEIAGEAVTERTQKARGSRKAS